MQVEVILNENSKLGKIGDTVKVTAGYARNYLLPYKKAVLATPENLIEFEKKRAGLEKIASEQLEAAKAQAGIMEALTLTVSARASEEGKLFGSIGPREIVEAAQQENIKLEKSQIHFPEGPIRQVGEHALTAHLHTDVIVHFKVNVTSNQEEKKKG
jgi:large subunit ribosomal protein L9